METVLFRKYFGDSLEHHRTLAKLSRKAMSEVLRVEESTVWRWENGKKMPERSDIVAAIYSREANTSVIDLWDDAVRRAKEAEAKGELETFLVPGYPTIKELDQADAEQAAEAARAAGVALDSDQDD